MRVGAFAISLAAILVIVIAGLASLLKPGWRFWPPPNTASLQYQLFWWPFRIYVAGLVTLSLVDFAPLTEGTLWWRIGVGVPLFGIGFGLAFYGSAQLGWANAHGAEHGLRTGGMYGWSRNPIYVVTIPGLVGLGLIVHSRWLYPLLALWALLYVVAPFLEEPWLEERYGETYREYQRSVHRFFGRVERPAQKKGRSRALTDFSDCG